MYFLVIDPGHGGRKPGAVRGEWRESAITLAVSQLLVDALRDVQYPPIRIALTRHSDVYVSQTDRARFANAETDVDLFLSIHCNAVKDPDAHGAEAWVCRGCSPRAALAAGKILSRYLARTGLWDRGVRVAPGPARPEPIYVLHATNMPAALLELAFLSHPGEGQLLADPGWQMLAARAIAHGIHDFFDARDGVR